MTVPIFAFNDIKHLECLDTAGVKDRLISYYYLNRSMFGKGPIRDKALKAQYDRNDDNFYLLDSGAFSAWRQGIVIDIFEYIDAVLQVQDLFTHMVCLDVIDDPVLSEANHQIMLEEGCTNVIPVFHAGESLNVLKYMVKQGYPYIGISPNNDWAESVKVSWLKDVWAQVDLNGVMTHGFGYMGKGGLLSVPLTTADSAAWIFHSAMGAIQTPVGLVYVTDRKIDDRQHISRLHDDSLHIVYDWIEEIGIHDLKELEAHHFNRKRFNAKAILILVRELVKQRELSKPVDRTGELFIDENSTGFGYTESFTEEAVEQAIKDIKAGKVKQIPLSDRKTSPTRKPKVEECMEVLF